MKRAFTLIELLVVITIISILAAILFPVFARAKATAKSAQCVGNERQAGVAFALYLGDHDDRYPPFLNKNPFPRTWVDFLQPYTKSREIWRCPSHEDAVPYDPAIATTTDWGKFMGHRYCSYWLNAYLNLYSSDLRPGATERTPITHTSIPFASTTIVLVDGPGSPGTDEHTGSPTDYALIYGDASEENHLWEIGMAAETRHSGKMNVLLADGHVKLFDRSQLRTTHTDANSDEISSMDPLDTKRNPTNDGQNPWWRP